MTVVTTPAWFPPVARMEHLDRLDALLPKPGIAPEVWAEVHETVQAELARLDTEVRQQIPEVRVVPGRTRGGSYDLNSYRTFSIPLCTVDPVVVTLTYSQGYQGVTIDADVSGEQTGDLIVSLPRETVGNSREELLATARESAQKLATSAEAIAAALQDPSRTVE